MPERRFFSINLYETLAIGFLSFISLHVYNLSVNQAVHQANFIHLKEQVLKNAIDIKDMKEQNRFPPKSNMVPKMFLLPDRRKIHSEILRES